VTDNVNRRGGDESEDRYWWEQGDKVELLTADEYFDRSLEEVRSRWAIAALSDEGKPSGR
jgi:hypothetical protein